MVAMESPTFEAVHSAQEKALKINLDAARFGTFAEIGAGQEVARWFFHVGKSSSTVAKSISAYDKAVSDALYGTTPIFVSRARLEAMLDREYTQLVEQLDATRGESTAFFVFADTVATHGSSRSSGGHGWLGVRFQDHPRAKPSEVLIHIEMLDAFTASQQEAVGLVGVNLIYGAYASLQDPTALMKSLMDGLDRRRIEIDLIKFSGPVFEGVDNRLMSLQLVEMGHTDVAMFLASGEVVQPSEVLHNRPVLIERGSFRPVTNVTLNMLDTALSQLRAAPDHPPDEPSVLMEMTLNNLLSGPSPSGSSIDHRDFLERAATLSALDKTVMISNYTRFDRVTTYLRQYTQNRIAMVVGIPTLRGIFEEKYYEELQGGILEGLGRLFRGSVKLVVYPTLAATGDLETADNIDITPKLKHLYDYLFENGFIQPVQQFSTEQLNINPGVVLNKIQSGDATWENFVPAAAADIIKRDRLFGLNSEKSDT
jgi:hypothetical protein